MAGCAPQEEGGADVGGVPQAIINGTRDTGHPEVVVVARTNSGGSIVAICSGTVLAQRKVLTAKHCVFNETSPGVYVAVAAARLQVLVATDITRPAGITSRINVASVLTTPGIYSEMDLSMGRDIAVVTTSANIGVTAREVARATPRSGDRITIVGFGRTTSGSTASGIKYVGQTRVSNVYINVFESNGAAWTCQGDSGGPAIDRAGRVIGITSFGTDETCATDMSFYTEVEPHLALIETAMGVPPPCTPRAPACNGADDDCDGVVDAGCTMLGGTCREDAECASNMCRLVGGEPICVQTCEPATATAGCPAGYVCEVTGCNVGSCVMGSAGPTPLDGPCTDDAQCVTHYCYTDTDGARYCAQQCQDGGACDGGRVCVTGGFPCGACQVDGPVLLPFGSACTTGTECREAICVEGSCSRACTLDADCPGDYRCESEMCLRGAPTAAGAVCASPDECVDAAPECVDVDGELVCAAACADSACDAGFACLDGHCVRDGAALGEPCVGNAECRSGLCASTCTRVCDVTRACPDGFDCVAAGMVSGCFPMADPGPPPSDGGCSVSSRKAGGWDERRGFGWGLGSLAFGTVVLLARRRA